MNKKLQKRKDFVPPNQRRKNPARGPKNPGNKRANQIQVMPIGDDDQIWEQIRGESNKAYSVFSLYLKLPPTLRNYNNLTKEIKKERITFPLADCWSVNKFQEWKEKYSWTPRLRSYDRWTLNEAHRQAAQELATEYVNQAKVGSTLYAKAVSALYEKTSDWWAAQGAKDLVSIAKLGFDTAREGREKARGLAFYNAEQSIQERDTIRSGSIEEAILDAVLRSDWQTVHKIAERMDTENDRGAQGLERNPLTPIEREQARTVIDALLGAIRAKSNGNGHTGSTPPSNGSTPALPPSNTPSNPPNDSGTPIDCSAADNETIATADGEEIEVTIEIPEKSGKSTPSKDYDLFGHMIDL